MTVRHLILAFILLPVILFGQDNSKPDAYKKFSHLLLLPSVDSPRHYTIAGGCFIRDAGDTYFVSIAAFFNGVDVYNGQLYPEKDPLDSLFIRYFDDRSLEFRLLKLNVTTYRKNAKPFFWGDYADIMCVRMPDELKPGYGIIEVAECPYDQNNENPDEIFIWGFQRGSDDSKIKELKDYQPVLYYNGSVRGDIADSLSENQKYNFTDFLIKPGCDVGFIGAPVFFKYTKNGKAKITFGGIVIGVDPNHHQLSCVVRPQQVKKAIDSIKNNGLPFYYP